MQPVAANVLGKIMGEGRPPVAKSSVKRGTQERPAAGTAKLRSEVSANRGTGAQAAASAAGTKLKAGANRKLHLPRSGSVQPAIVPSGTRKSGAKSGQGAAETAAMAARALADQTGAKAAAVKWTFAGLVAKLSRSADNAQAVVVKGVFAAAQGPEHATPGPAAPAPAAKPVQNKAAAPQAGTQPTVNKGVTSNKVAAPAAGNTVGSPGVLSLPSEKAPSQANAAASSPAAEANGTATAAKAQGGEVLRAAGEQEVAADVSPPVSQKVIAIPAGAAGHRAVQGAAAGQHAVQSVAPGQQVDESAAVHQVGRSPAGGQQAVQGAPAGRLSSATRTAIAGSAVVAKTAAAAARAARAAHTSAGAAVAGASSSAGGRTPAAAMAAQATAAAPSFDGGQGPGPASTPTVDVSLAHQIAQTVRSSGVKLDRQIIVSLEPPELGRVKVSLRASGNRVRGVLEADNPETLRRLEREAPALAERLQEAGVQIRRLDVVLAKEQSRGDSAYEDPLARDGRQQAQDRSAPGPSYAAALSPAAVTAAGPAAATEAGPAGTSAINVRI